MYKKIFVSSDLADGGRAVLHRFHTQSLRHRHGQVVGPHAKWTCHGLDMFNNITKKNTISIAMDGSGTPCWLVGLEMVVVPHVGLEMVVVAHVGWFGDGSGGPWWF